MKATVLDNLMNHKQAARKPGASEKAVFVRDMFAEIALRYDLLNDILSFYRHRTWRRVAVRMAEPAPGDHALDICSGTGDFAIELYRHVGEAGYVVGADFCEPMLRHGKVKTDRCSGGRIAMILADAENLPYADNSFDCVTVGFGIRNVTDASKAIAEMARVAKSGGRVVCLEFNRPTQAFWRTVVNIYQNTVLPRIGGMLSRRDAYTYLPESIQTFYTREELKGFMEQAGLSDVKVCNLNFGSVCIHLGTKL